MLRDMLCADFLATADLPELFTASTGWTVATGVGARGNDAYENVGGTQLLHRTPMSAPSGATAIVGFRFEVTAIPGSGRDILQVLDTGTIQLSVAINADGTLKVVRGGVQFGTTIGTSSLTLLTNTHYFIELHAVIANSGGTATVYVNGVSALAVTGADTQVTASASWNTYGLAGCGAGTTTRVSDIYAADAVAGEIDDVLGDVRVDSHGPTSDGGVDQWTPSTGTDAYAMLDEAAPDDDTTYIESSTTDQRTVCGFDDLVPTGAALKGVAVIWNMKKTDAGASTVAPVIRRSATNYDGTAQAPSEDVYSYFGQVYETDPDTSAAWTETNFNAMEAGVKKVS